MTEASLYHSGNKVKLPVIQTSNRRGRSPDLQPRKRNYRWGEMSAVVDWLREAMQQKQVSQSELARRMGVDRVLINKALHGRRRVTADELIKIAQALDVHPPLTLVRPSNHTRYLKVIGEVAAGAWKEVGFVHDFESYSIPVVIDPKWPDEAVYALEVHGESVNRQARDGDVVSVLRAEYAPRSFTAGDWVVVERIRGDLRETTIKQVRRNGRGWELWPDSTDPRYQEPVLLEQEGVDTVRVIGFVLSFVRLGTQF